MFSIKETKPLKKWEKYWKKSGKSQVICQSGKVGEYSNKV